eukprot:1127348-Amphidinium_carterae.2
MQQTRTRTITKAETTRWGVCCCTSITLHYQVAFCMESLASSGKGPSETDKKDDIGSTMTNAGEGETGNLNGRMEEHFKPK